MFRRSRFSVRPNVGTVGRAGPPAPSSSSSSAAAAQPQEVSSVNQEAGDTSKNVSEGNTTAEINNKSDVTTEKAAAAGDTNDQNGEGSSSSAAVQRRKRFSVRPKVAPGRLPSLSRTPKSPVKAVSSEAPVEASGSGSDPSAQTTPTVNAAAAPGLLSPRRRRPSEGCKQPRIQAKPTVVSPAAESQEQTQQPAESSKKTEKTSSSQIKDGPLMRAPDKVPPSIPDREAFEISEKAKTLVSSKNVLSLSPSAYSLSRLLNDPSDLQRLVKAQKLRELLRQESRKEKTLKKAKSRAREYSLDPAKMTMRDLIRYLPTTNPMLGSSEDAAQENEIVIPPSPRREEPPTQAPEPEAPPDATSPRGEEEEAEEDEDEAVMVPQVKVAEDGSLIIDEESLTVEVQRAKGPNVAQTRDPIFERGSTTTYSSFRKGTYSRPWSSEETDMFFLAVSMVGTDFSMICQLFTHRARSEIKNKFKKEEKINGWRIDKAFKERRKLDIEYFSKLLEKIMEVQRNKKKLKSLAGKNAPKKGKRKTTGRKSARKLSDVEEADEDEDEELPDLDEEGEKENEDQCDEPRKGNKRKKKRDVTTKEPRGKKRKTGESGGDQGEVDIPEDAQADVPEDETTSEILEQTEDPTKEAPIKPAKLSQGRAPKPTLPLGRKWGKKTQPSTKPKDAASDKGGEDEEDGACEDQQDEEPSSSSQAKRKKVISDISSEEEDTTMNPPKPTRSGRVPKRTKLLTYPCKEDAHSSASETSPVGSPAPASKPKHKSTAKKRRPTKPSPAQKSKKPKLVTLRASQSEFSDEEGDRPWVDEEEVELQQVTCSPDGDSSALAFVSAGLHNLQSVMSDVDESLVEDVMDLLSTEHTEVSEDQSYNEAAQTLLTISNVAHISQSTENTIQQPGTSDGASELFHSVEELIETSETFATVEVHTVDGSDLTVMKPSDETCEEQESEMEPKLQPIPEMASEGPPQTKKGRLSKVKPKPNLGRTARTAQLKSQSEVEETAPNTQDVPSTLLKDDAACVEVQSGEELNRKESGSELSGFSGSRTESSMHQTTGNINSAPQTIDEKPESSVGTSEIAVKDLLTHDSANTEIKQGPCKDSVTVVESHDESAASVLHAEDPKGESVGATTCRRSRLQKVKPNLSLSTRTTRAKPEETVKPAEKNPTPCESTRDTETTESSSNNMIETDSAVSKAQDEQGSNVNTNTIPEDHGHSITAVTREEELSSSHKEVEVASTSQVRRSRFQKVKPNLPKSKPLTTEEPAKKDLTQDKGATSESTDESLTSSVQTTVSSSNNVVEIHSVVSKEPEAQGSIVDSAPIAEDQSQATISAEEEILSSQKEVKVASTSQPTRGRLQKVKPTPNLQHMSRSGSRLKPQPIEEPAAKDSDLCESTRDTTPEITEEPLTSCVQTTVSGSDNVVETQSAVSKALETQGPIVDSAPTPENQSHATISAALEEETPCSQKEVEVASTSQPTRGRLQKVKPKPNLPQMSRSARSKPQTVKEPAEKDPDLSESTRHTTPEITEEPLTSCVQTTVSGSDYVVETHSVVSKTLETQGSIVDSPPILEDQSQATISAEEEILSSQKEVEVASTSQPTRGRLQKFKPKPNLPQMSRSARLKPQTIKEPAEKDPDLSESTRDTTPEITEEPLTSCVQTTVSGSDNVVETHSVVSKAPDPQGSIVDSAPIPEDHSQATISAAHEEETSCSQKEVKVPSNSQPTRGRLQKVKPKPNLPQMSRSARSKPQTIKEPEEKDSDLSESIRDTTPEITEEPLTSSVQTTVSGSDNVVETHSVVSKALETQGSIVDSAPIQEDHSHATISAEEETSCSQKEVEVASTSQPTRGRLQKVKPKPNLPQMSRSARLKPQTIKEPAEKDPDLSESTRDTTPEITEEPLTSLVQTSATTTVPDGNASIVDSASVQEDHVLPTICPQKVEDLPANQEQTGVASTSQLRRARLPKPKPNLPGTLKTLRSKPQTTEEQADKSSTPTSETEIGQQPTPTSTPTSEPAANKDHRTCPEPVDQVEPTLTISDEGAPEKQNLPEATSKLFVEQNVKITDKGPTDQIATTETSSNKVVATDSAVTQSQIEQGSNKGSAPVEEAHGLSVVSASPEVAQVESLSRLRRSRFQKPKPNLPQISRTTGPRSQATKGPKASTQAESASENQNIPKVKESTPEITVENLPSHIQEIQSSCTDEVATKSVIVESEVGSNVESDPSKEASATHVEESSTSQEEAQIVSTSQIRRTRLQKVKPKPNLSQSRTVQSKPEPTKDTDVLAQNMEKIPRIPTADNTGLETQPSCSASQPETSSQIKSTSVPSVSSSSLDGGLTQETSAEGERKDPEPRPEQNVPQQRRRFPQVKPRLASSFRSTQAMLQRQDALKPSEENTTLSTTPEPQLPRDSKDAQRDPEVTEKDDELLSPSSNKELISTKSLEKTDAEASNGLATATSQVVEDETVLKLSNESTIEVKTAGDENPSNVPVENQSASQSTNVSTRDSQPITEQIMAATPNPGVQSAQTGSTESKADLKPTCPEKDLSGQSTNGAKSELAESSKTTRNAPPPRRGRLIKPKPSLEGHSRLQPAQKIQKTTPAGSDSACCSSTDDKSMSASQETVQKVAEEFNNQGTNITQVSTDQNASSSTDKIQSNPLLSQMMPSQVPSDPDEPFFILSLTEIPVPSSSELENIPTEPLTDASAQPSRGSGDSLVTTGGPTLSVKSTKETVSITVQQTSGMEAPAAKDLHLEHPGGSKGTKSAAVEPPRLPEPADSNKATVPPTKQKLPGRRAKLQIAVNTGKKRQTRQAFAAKETEDIQTDQTLPEASNVIISEPRKERGGGDADVEVILIKPGSSSSEQTSRTSRLSRKGKASDPPPSKATSKGSEAQTPSATGKRLSSAESAASTSHTLRETQKPEETSSKRTEPPPIHRPVLSDSTAEVSSSQQSVCVEISSQPEESITVSQYFLSDIFTEVEEG